LLLAGCASTETSAENAAAEPFVPLPDEEPATIGYLLTQLDKSFKRWSDLKLTAADPKEQHALDALERNLQKRTRERQDELIVELESGPPTNREIAAVALGFTRDPAALSPLLSALSDRDPSLVQKALLGIGILGLPETPLSQVTYLLLHDPDPWTRNNAAFAVQRISAAGAREPGLAESVRLALGDEEPGVRAQCASTLGILEDREAVKPLGHLLHDDVNLVAAAAVTALAHLGRFQLECKGPSARLLADALDQVEAGRREQIHRGLVLLSDQDLGRDSTAWREWAYRLP
jgi:HEAT repeat protein